MRLQKLMRIGIDAGNLRQGGGITHLTELLRAANPQLHGFTEIVVWGGDVTLSRLPELPWLRKVNIAMLNRSLLWRMFWQARYLSEQARATECDVLFVPGGSFVGSFSPTVLMSQNLLPFEWLELKRAGYSLQSAKMFLLRLVQRTSFKRAQGVIYLSQYGKKAVEAVTGSLRAPTCIIAHGLPSAFLFPAPLPIRSLADCDTDLPLRIVCVGNIDAYKHPVQVLRAVARLRYQGYPITLEFIGPGVPKWVAKLQSAISKIDHAKKWVRYLGAISPTQLQEKYAQADLAIFASSCETFGIILLEEMAMGIPIICSNRSAMPEVVQDAALYCDPENHLSISTAIKEALLSDELRQAMRNRGYAIVQQYSWKKCASETFSFLKRCALTSHS
jgi:glycosyltransferase involved in cell wall biosynthesis